VIDVMDMEMRAYEVDAANAAGVAAVVAVTFGAYTDFAAVAKI
jgi:hypothetical protein